jgi:hypothetical protein
MNSLMTVSTPLAENAGNAEKTYSTELGDLLQDQHFERLRISATKLQLVLHRQPSLGDEFGHEIFILSKPKVLKTFDHLSQVETFLSNKVGGCHG